MNKENIEIRFAREEELKQVNYLRKQVHELHCNGRPDVFKPNGWDAIRELEKVRFASKEGGVIVANNGQEIVGFAVVQFIHNPESAFWQENNFYHIEEFGVDEKHRRCGIATLLMNFMRQDAKDRGFEKIELNTWEFNESALRFYENLGFQTYRRDLQIRV